MKKIIYIFALLGFMFGLNAQTKDPNAVKLLNSVSQSYQKPTFLKFNYTLKNSKEGINQNEKGSVYISGDKYNLSLLNTSQIYDGKKVYNISEEDKEVTITNNPSKEELLTPTKVLNSYKSGYAVAMSGTKTVNGKKATMITLTPTDKNSPTTKIELAIDSAKKDLIQVAEYNKQGTVTTITITEISKNMVIPKSIFSFKESFYKGKGYYITVL